MARRSSWLVPILLITVVVTLPGAHAFAFSFSPAEHPSACHSHTPAKQPLAPVNYQCCAGGHDAAVPSKAFSSSPPLLQPEDLDGSPELVSSGALPSLPFVASTNSPPELTPLRI
jgi:hypothetical protein